MNQLETRACLFAHPAKHSLSPAMHNAALEFLGIAARYEARDVLPESLATEFTVLRNSSLWGANLSIPTFTADAQAEQQFGAQYINNLLGLYVTNLQSKTNVTFNQAALQQLFGAAATN